MRRIVALAAASLSFAVAAHAAPPSQQYKLAPLGAGATLVAPAVDRAKALAEDASAPKAGPLRYAIVSKHDAAARDAKGRSNAGEWTTLADGRVVHVGPPAELMTPEILERVFGTPVEVRRDGPYPLAVYYR